MIPSRVLWAVALCSGCAWISPGDLENKLNEIDQDGDGAPYRGGDNVIDCDDNDPDRKPGGPELPYDGIDNNCDPDDDVLEYDVDGDGFPGISAADHQAIIDAAAEDGHEVVFDGTTPIETEDVDCRDLVPDGEEGSTADIFPGAEDVPYDGVDSDCGRDNDFDLDDDGYMPASATVAGATVDVEAAYAAYLEEWGYQDEQAGWVPVESGLTAPVLDVAAGIRDCTDTDPAVNPGVTEDPPYDGIDANCDDVNDFDQDGDGAMPNAITEDGEPCPAELLGDPSCTDTESGLYGAYVARYYGSSSPPWDVPAEGAFADCLDVDGLVDALGQPIDPSTVYVGATDAPYDGVDSDCDRGNDFDQDNDYFMPDTVPAGATDEVYGNYVTQWGYELEQLNWVQPGTIDLVPPLGDCDDTNPTSNPRGLEALSDGGADGDCNGAADTSPWGFGLATWRGLSRPRVTRVGDKYLVAVTAQGAVTSLGGTEALEVGLALIFGLDVASDAYHDSTQTWKFSSATQPVGEQIDFALTSNGDSVWFGTPYQAGTSQFLTLKKLNYDYESEGFSQGAPTNTSLFDDFGVDALDIVVDSVDLPLVAGCDVDTLVVGYGEGTPESQKASVQANQCFFTEPAVVGSPALLSTCSPIGCEDFSVDFSAGVVLGASSASSYDGIRYGDLRDDTLVILDDGNGVVLQTAGGPSQRFLANVALQAVDAVRYDGEYYVIGLEEASGPAAPRLYFAQGTNAASSTATVLPWEGLEGSLEDDYAVFGVGVHADDNRIAFAVSAEAITPVGDLPDRVGWMFLQP